MLERIETGWLIPKTTGFASGMWQVIAQVGRGRIGAAEALPSIIERCLMAQTAKGGPLTEIASRYAASVQALNEWRALLDKRAQKRLGQVAAYLAGQPDPDHDGLGHQG